MSQADRMTPSRVSSKNALERCTRTVYQTSSPVSAVRLLKARYLRILKDTGKAPIPMEPVFKLESGEVLSRKTVTSKIQDLMESVGVPRTFSGSHSLRRGGASMYRGAGCPEMDVMRFERWTSNAYKLYIHIENQAMNEWAEKAATTIHRFELN